MYKENNLNGFKAAYSWFQNISSQSAEQAFRYLLPQILERYEMTVEKFNRLRLKKVEKLDAGETMLMKRIRESIPKGNADTYFQKILPAEDIPKYLGEEGYSTIRGFISKYEDVSHLKSYESVVESFRLDYVVNGKRPFPEGGDTYGYIKFKTNDIDNITIPFGKKLGGVNTDPPPCTLNGFTGARNGELIPEWYVEGGNYLKPLDGAEIHEVVNGVDTVIGVYKNNYFERINKGE